VEAAAERRQLSERERPTTDWCPPQSHNHSPRDPPSTHNQLLPAQQRRPELVEHRQLSEREAAEIQWSQREAAARQLSEREAAEPPGPPPVFARPVHRLPTPDSQIGPPPKHSVVLPLAAQPAQLGKAWEKDKGVVWDAQAQRLPGPSSAGAPPPWDTDRSAPRQAAETDRTPSEVDAPHLFDLTDRSHPFDLTDRSLSHGSRGSDLPPELEELQHDILKLLAQGEKTKALQLKEELRIRMLDHRRLDQGDACAALLADLEEEGVRRQELSPERQVPQASVAPEAVPPPPSALPSAQPTGLILGPPSDKAFATSLGLGSQQRRTMIVTPPAPAVLPGVRAETRGFDAKAGRIAGDQEDDRPAWQVDMGEVSGASRPLPRTPPVAQEIGLFEGRRLGAGLDHGGSRTRGPGLAPCFVPQKYVPRPPQPKGQRPPPHDAQQAWAGSARTFGALRMHLVPADAKDVQEIAERDRGVTPDTAATESDTFGCQPCSAPRRAATKVLSVPGVAMAPRASGMTPPRASMPMVPYMSKDEAQPLFGMHATKMSRAEIYVRLGVEDPHCQPQPRQRPDRPLPPSPVSLELSPRLPTIDLSHEPAPAQRAGPPPARPNPPKVTHSQNAHKVAPAHLAAPAASRQNFVKIAAAPDKRGKCTIM